MLEGQLILLDQFLGRSDLLAVGLLGLGYLESSPLGGLLVQQFDFLGLELVDGGGIVGVLLLLELLRVDEALVSLDSGVDLGDHSLGRKSSSGALWHLGLGGAGCELLLQGKDFLLEVVDGQLRLHVLVLGQGLVLEV